MYAAKQERESHRCGPERYPAAQSEQRVAAKEEFFKEGDEQEKQRKEQRELDHAYPVQGSGAKVEYAGAAQRQEEETERHKPPHHSPGESLAERASCRQSVGTERAFLDAAHGDSGHERAH